MSQRRWEVREDWNEEIRGGRVRRDAPQREERRPNTERRQERREAIERKQARRLRGKEY